MPTEQKADVFATPTGPKPLIQRCQAALAYAELAKLQLRPEYLKFSVGVLQAEITLACATGDAYYENACNISRCTAILRAQTAFQSEIVELVNSTFGQNF